MTIDFRNFKFREATHSDASPTMGQFLNFVDSHKEWDDEKKKSHFLDHLSQPVLRWTKTNIKDYETLEWKSVKRKMIERFYVKLSIRQKVELRKELCQRLDESCQDFLDRCKKYQYLLCDDDIDFVMERDVLVNFLLGIRGDFFDTLIGNENLHSLEAFFVEAVKLEAMLQVKVEDNFEEPIFTKDDRVKMEAQIEPLDFLVQKTEFDVNDDNDFIPEDDIIPEPTIDDDFVADEPLETDDKKSVAKPETERRSSSRATKLIGHPSYYESDNDKEDPDFNEEDSDFMDPDDSDNDTKKRKGKTKKDDDDDDFNPEDEEEEPVPVKFQVHPCEYCGKKYKLKAKLVEHTEKHHKNLIDPSAKSEDGDTSKLFKCGFCDLSFKDRRLLTCVSSAMTSTKFSKYS